MQGWIVAVIVAWCSVYAAWSLLPAPARRALARVLLRLKLPAPLAAPLQRALRPAGACGGCDSCGSTAPKPIRIHRR